MLWELPGEGDRATAKKVGLLSLFFSRAQVDHISRRKTIQSFG